jgi:hypothetical protein
MFEEIPVIVSVYFEEFNCISAGFFCFVVDKIYNVSSFGRDKDGEEGVS